MHQHTNLRKSHVIKRSRKTPQPLLDKALIICTSEAPQTVKRSSDVWGSTETKLRAQRSGVHIAVGAGDFYFVQNIQNIFAAHTASHSVGNGVLSRG
jgi:hypothetical protein